MITNMEYNHGMNNKQMDAAVKKKWNFFVEIMGRHIDESTNIDYYIRQALKSHLNDEGKSLWSNIGSLLTNGSESKYDKMSRACEEALESVVVFMRVAGIPVVPLVNGIVPFAQFITAFDSEYDHSSVDRFSSQLIASTDSALDKHQIMLHEREDIKYAKNKIDEDFAEKLHAKLSPSPNLFYADYSKEIKEYFFKFQEVSRDFL